MDHHTQRGPRANVVGREWVGKPCDPGPVSRAPRDARRYAVGANGWGKCRHDLSQFPWKDLMDQDRSVQSYVEQSLPVIPVRI